MISRRLPDGTCCYFWARGNRVTFAMPLLFIGDEYNTDVVRLPQVVDAYSNNTPEDPRRTGPTGGASVCYAPIDPTKEGDPRLPTASLVFSASWPKVLVF